LFFFTFNQISSFKKIKQFCDFNVYFYYAKEVEMYEKMIVNLDEFYIVFIMPKIEKTKNK
jgi:hypothetical protein